MSTNQANSYCNSILQALYYSEPFRENVVNYPVADAAGLQNMKQYKAKVSIRQPVQQPNGNAAGAKNQKSPSTAQALKQRQIINSPQYSPTGQPLRPEDRPDAPEYKKKQAMLKGPVLELTQENPEPYGMQECTFTGLRDIFTALIESQSRTGVLSPQRFLDIFKRDNEMFRTAMHQDAHEFYGLVLNDVISNVEAHARLTQEREENRKNGVNGNALTSSSLMKSKPLSGVGVPGTGWVHDIFEGVLTSETKCLTCETASQRDETFLDLSIDLEQHSSVTSCLRKFSAEEMLCERNKFHCDHCGGLQEAEKRMKIKKLPKVLALHLKRFKYTEDFTRLQKLFHRVVYPYHLRMFNTTDDAQDPDRMYELYAVVVHIGGNAYHGHYVSVIKTKDRGWVLFDDEMVEPVDKHFVRNFFGDKPGMACAYVLFYQEVSFEQVRDEQDAEGWEEASVAEAAEGVAAGAMHTNGTTDLLLSKLNSRTELGDDDHDALATLNHARTAPGEIPSATEESLPPLPLRTTATAQPPGTHPLVAAPPPAPAVMTAEDEVATNGARKSREDKPRDKKEEKAQEKARKAAEKEQARLAEEEEKRRKKEAAVEEKNGHAIGDKTSGGGSGFLSRAGKGSISMTRKSFAFLGKSTGDKDKSSNSNGLHVDKKGEEKKLSSSPERNGTSPVAPTTSSAGGVLPPVGEGGGGIQRQQTLQPPAPGGFGDGGKGQNGHSPTRAYTHDGSQQFGSFSQQQAQKQQQQLQQPPLPTVLPRPPPEPKLKERVFSFGLMRKKSSRFLS